MAFETQGRGRQRGISLFGLIFWAAIVAVVVVVAMRVFPTVNEYLTIKRTIDKIVTEGAPTVPEVRAAFDRQRDVEYSISTISGKDLNITKENEKLVISFAYNKEVELVEPVFLLIKYKGHSK
jgi:hypothetical protein